MLFTNWSTKDISINGIIIVLYILGINIVITNTIGSKVAAWANPPIVPIIITNTGNKAAIKSASLFIKSIAIFIETIKDLESKIIKIQ